MNGKLFEGSHPLVIKAAKSNNIIALSIINTKKLSNSELEFVFSFLNNNDGYIFYDVVKLNLRNKYIFIQPYTDNKIEILD